MASQLNITRCFLCRQKSNQSLTYKSIDTCCPASKKLIKDVLQYLARQANTELHIGNEWLCLPCYNQLVDYDTAVVTIIRKQQCLSKLVEKAAINVGIDTDFEEECDQHMAILEELNDDNFFNDVHVSETEINQTISEALQSKSAPTNQRTIQRVGNWKRRRYSETPMQCGFCAMEFKNQLRLQKHVRRAHKKFSCTVCSFSHRNEDYVMLHQNIHDGRNENQCRFCDKVFTTKISTIRHMEVHFDKKKYQCDKCGLCFSQTTVLYNHKLQHEAEEQPLSCDICNQVFKTKRTFRHHMITHRADRPRYSCEYCGKTFTEKYTLKVHKRSHPEAEPQQQQSEQIDPNTSNAVSTQLTNPATTGAENKFNCIICDQAFTNKEHLNKHMEKEHDVILKSLTLVNFSQYEVVTNETKKPCHICGHMFRTQTNLDHHLTHMHGLTFN